LFVVSCLVVLLCLVAVGFCGVVFEKSVTVHALAVSGGSGEVINIDVIMLHPGDGRVYVAASPLPYGPEGALFITSSQLAMYIASTIAGVNPDNYTFLIRPESTLVMIGGPSASGYITCAMYALLTNSTFRNNVTMTGMILPGGIIGPVGGVPLKIKAAAERGFRIILIPAFNYLMLSPGSIPRNVKVIPVIDVYHAIQYFTGRKILYTNITLSDIRKIKIFKTITRFIWKLIYARFNSTVKLDTIPDSERREIINLYNEAVKLAHEGDYYSAASTLYKALIEYYRAYISVKVSELGLQYLYTVRDEVRNMLKDVESRLSRYNALNPISVDLIVGIYDRIEQARDLLSHLTDSLLSGDINSAVNYAAEALARTETLYDWLKVLEQVHASLIISPEAIARLSKLYIEFLKSVMGYSELIQTYGLESIAEKIGNLEELYREGHYLKALSLSFIYSSELTSDIVYYFVTQTGATTGLLDYVKPLRQVILSELWYLSRRNLTSLFAYMYLEYGDYYLNKAREDLQNLDTSRFSRDIALAYNFYTNALLHLMLLKSLAIESGTSKLTLIIVENRSKFPLTPEEHENITVHRELLKLKLYINPHILVLYVALLASTIIVLAVLVLIRERRSYVTQV